MTVFKIINLTDLRTKTKKLIKDRNFCNNHSVTTLQQVVKFKNMTSFKSDTTLDISVNADSN